MSIDAALATNGLLVDSVAGSNQIERDLGEARHEGQLGWSAPRTLEIKTSMNTNAGRYDIVLVLTLWQSLQV